MCVTCLSMCDVSDMCILQNNERLAVLEAELSYQEIVYKEAQKKHVDMQESFDRQVKELYMVRLGSNMSTHNM